MQNCYLRIEIFLAIKASIIELIGAKNLPEPSEISESLYLESDFGLDSLDQIELMLSLEEKFDVSVPAEDAKKCETIKDIIDLVELIVLRK